MELWYQKNQSSVPTVARLAEPSKMPDIMFSKSLERIVNSQLDKRRKSEYFNKLKLAYSDLKELLADEM